MNMYNQSYAARLDTLARALECRRMEQAAPVDELSKSLYELEHELTRLDDLGKASLLAEMNRNDPLEGTMPLNLTMPDIDRMIGDVAR